MNKSIWLIRANLLTVALLMACVLLIHGQAWADSPASVTHYSCDFFTVQELEANFDLVVTAVHPEEKVDLCNIDVTSDEVNGLSVTVYDNIGPEVWALGIHKPEQEIGGLGRAAYWSQFGPVIWTLSGQRLEITLFGKLTDESREKWLQLLKMAVARLDAAMLEASGQNVREQLAALPADSPCLLIPLNELQEAFDVHVRSIVADVPNNGCRLETHGRDAYGFVIHLMQDRDEMLWNLMKKAPIPSLDGSPVRSEEIADLGESAYWLFSKTSSEVHILTAKRREIAFRVASRGSLSEPQKMRLLVGLRHAVERLQ